MYVIIYIYIYLFFYFCFLRGVGLGSQSEKKQIISGVFTRSCCHWKNVKKGPESYDNHDVKEEHFDYLIAGLLGKVFPVSRNF